ncbi:MAG: ParB/RepB/Spo0J family partition protein [Patescibacteria group bacterium]
MVQFFSNSIFWVEVEKIQPNPFQPRREFEQARLNDLAESIRQYGILQPLVVTRKEELKGDEGLSVYYELISGERRLRASKIAGLKSVPVLIRSDEESDRMKLELAIIENLQREDLNAVDRAKAFEKLSKEFKLNHGQIGQKVGKSREYVSNTLRILLLPEEMLSALSEGKISEGHTRPLLMLADRKEEQATLFKEILYKKVTVREAELIARRIATDRARNKESLPDPEIAEMERKLTESLGTRVQIERRQKGGRISIEYFSSADLHQILDLMKSNEKRRANELLNRYIASVQGSVPTQASAPVATLATAPASTPTSTTPDTPPVPSAIEESPAPLDDRTKEEKESDENNEELYSVKNFSL